MPAILAVKAQDHYALLGIDPQSVAETMHQAYAEQARKYRPQNSLTGDAEMFNAINLAYEVLSDPVRRREYDELHGIGQQEGGPRFSGAAFFNGLEREEVLRSAILCLLYDRRRTRPSATLTFALSAAALPSETGELGEPAVEQPATSVAASAAEGIKRSVEVATGFTNASIFKK